MDETESLNEPTPEAIWLDKRMAIVARDKRLDAIPDVLYVQLFWELIGFLGGRAMSEGLDEWTMNYIHDLLDRLELEVL